MSRQPGDLLRVVGQDADAGQPKIDQDLCPDAVVTQVRRKAQPQVGLDGVESLFLELVCAQLVEKADPAALLAEVQQDAGALRLDHRKRRLELLAAVAAHRVEDVAGEAFGVDAHKDVLRAVHLAFDERDMVLTVEHRAVADRNEVAERGRQARGDDTLDELLRATAVGDQIRHRDHLQPVASAVPGQVGDASHGAVVVHDLAYHPGRYQTCKPCEVDRRLRLPDSLERPTRPGLEREHVPRLYQLTRAGLGIDRHLNRASPVGCGYAGADPRACFDGDRERCLERRLVLCRHQIEAELVAALRGQRQADQAASLLGHEVDRLGSDELGGHRQIALVLAVLVVADHHHLALADVLDRVLDRRERALDCCHRAVPPGISRSTYFASTSTSRLTVIPGSAWPRLVRSSVSGIRETVNDRSSRSATVSETPSTVIDPLYTRYRRTAGSASILTRREKPSSTTPAILPTPSTWPWTMCPPRRSCKRIASSRLTGMPSPASANELSLSVSFITSALK